MDLQLAIFNDLDQISRIEKDTNEYPWSSSNFESSLSAGNSSLVLRDEKNILGYAFFSVIGTDAHLLNITVSKDYQGKGYGKKILCKVLFQSKVLGAKNNTTPDWTRINELNWLIDRELEDPKDHSPSYASWSKSQVSPPKKDENSPDFFTWKEQQKQDDVDDDDDDDEPKVTTKVLSMADDDDLKLLKTETEEEEETADKKDQNGGTHKISINTEAFK